MDLKQSAAEAAINFISNDMNIGLGTGSTVEYFLRALGTALKEGRLRNVKGMPTSVWSEKRARELGIPLISLKDCPDLDVTVDGADEIDPELNLIKGLGGALLREKIVAQHTRQMVVIADGSKTVPVLGTKGPLPVEVIPFEHEVHEAFFRKLGAEPTLRRNADGSPYVTDNGNYIYHCQFKQIDRPVEVEAALHAQAGIVETGLFLGIAKVAIIAYGDRVETVRSSRR